MKSRRINNAKHLIEYRKQLRSNMTIAEAGLWRILKGKKIQGLKFRRQHSIGNYIIDFYCPSQKIAIELDGEIHNDITKRTSDYKRDLYLKDLGITVLRFENKMVFQQPEMIVACIENELLK